MEIAEQSAATAEQEFLRTGPQFGAHWMFLARSLLLEATGSVDGAYAILCAAWDALASAGMVSELPVLGPDLVRIAIRQGNRARAEEATAALEDVASKADVASLSGTALRCRGLLEASAPILAAAVAVLRASPRPLDLAIACEDAAALAVQSGDTEGGRRLFNEAVAIYEGLDASRDAGRAESRMRAYGLRRGRRERRNRPKTGWEALTWTEMKVVRLVAEGLTNPEIAERMFISRRTVATHVSDALAKVGVSSRVALAAEAARRVD
jgi:DNA-binding CsgD family transcriptional regulator